jgi:hypothetical protein
MMVSSRGGVPVYTDYKDNIIVDRRNSILAWKADKDRLRPSWFSESLQRDFPGGLPKLGSVHSEDALTWNVFRTLQQEKQLQCITQLFSSGLDIYQIWFWGHDSNRQSKEIDPEIHNVLDEMEPWGKGGVRQQTEPDVILKGENRVIMVECKLGKRDDNVKAWQRSSTGMRREYAVFMKEQGFKLFNDSFDYEGDGNRFYQLFRNYVLGAALASKWNTEFSLLVIVNALNSNLEGRSHQDEFDSFRAVLADPSNTFLITWQQIFNALPKQEDLLPLRNYMVGHPLLGFSQG